MDLLKFAIWTLVSVLVIFTQVASANTDSDQAFPGSLYRSHLAGAELPNHIAYRSLLMHLQQSENAATDIEQRLGWSAIEANNFLDWARNSYTSLIAANRQVTERMLCGQAAEPDDENQTYRVMNSLDDIKETNLRQHYARLLTEQNVPAALQDWLEELKQTRSHIKYDHAAMYKHINQQPGRVVQLACQRLSASR